jgi:hypothetical protein
MEYGVEFIRFDGSFCVRGRGRARLVEGMRTRMNCRGRSGRFVGTRDRLNGFRFERLGISS